MSLYGYTESSDEKQTFVNMITSNPIGVLRPSSRAHFAMCVFGDLLVAPVGRNGNRNRPTNKCWTAFQCASSSVVVPAGVAGTVLPFQPSSTDLFHLNLQRLTVVRWLRQGLVLGEDYRVVNFNVWRYWLMVYGGGPSIGRAAKDIYSRPAIGENS